MKTATGKTLIIYAVTALVLLVFAFGLYFATMSTRQTAQDDGGIGVTVNENINSPIALFSAPSDMTTVNGHRAYTLTATVTPNYAANKTLDWSVAWSDASSTWATGKIVTDYIAITPTTDGALTAYLESLGTAFGEQIIVTASLRSDPSISATATVDYFARVTGGAVSFKNGNTTLATSDANNQFKINLSDLSTFSANNIALTPVYGDHTEVGSVYYTYKFSFTTVFSSNLAYYGYTWTNSEFSLVGGLLTNATNHYVNIDDFKLNGNIWELLTALGVSSSHLESLKSNYQIGMNGDDFTMLNIKAICRCDYWENDIELTYPVVIDGTSWPTTTVALADNSYGF